MKTIKAIEIIAYYDGIEVFTGEDAAANKYVASRMATAGDHDEYAVVEVSAENMEEFLSGSLDLRNLMLRAPGGEWYITVANMEYGEPMLMEPQDTPLKKSDVLPSPGFTMSN